jgi:hypothetical protein
MKMAKIHSILQKRLPSGNHTARILWLEDAKRYNAETFPISANSPTNLYNCVQSLKMAFKNWFLNL